MTTHFDCLIIGGGPGGLTAALTLARQCHTAAIFDSGEYHNAGTLHMHMLPTWDHKSPTHFRTAARENILTNYPSVTYLDVRVETVCPREGGSAKAQNCFELTTETGSTYYGAKLILASGCKDVLPDIPGFAAAWPTSIFHCLFCHGYEQRGAASSGLLAVGPIGSNAPGALHFARNALQLTEKVVVYTDGDEALAQEIDAQMGGDDADANAIRTRLSTDARKIRRIAVSSLSTATTNNAEVILHFEDSSASATEAFLMHMPVAVPRGDFIEQLGLETKDGNVAITSQFYETSMRGVFAVGDITAHQKIFNHALSSGCSAGAGVAVQLQAEKWGHRPLGGH